jgi:hypothetical protein
MVLLMMVGALLGVVPGCGEDEEQTQTPTRGSTTQNVQPRNRSLLPTPAEPAVEPEAGRDLVPSAPQGWREPEVTVASETEDIWELINGEADQYHAYDMIDLTYATYELPEDEVVVEIFRMPRSLDAFGVFSQWRSMAERVVDLPCGPGAWTSNSLNFGTGRYFVRIKMPWTDDALAEATRLARAICKRYSRPLEEPEIAGDLPAGALPNSLQYIKRGYRGRDRLNEVVTARYPVEGSDETAEVFVVEQEDAGAAVETLKGWAKDLPEAQLEAEEPAGLSWADEFDGRIIVFQVGRYLVGATRGRQDLAVRVVETLQGRQEQD